ncbi:MAG: type ISP restriction/modification enzyme, partial [Desulfovibrionaceae bacterium]
FRNAFPRMTERLGIVYTPVEVVDFIIHSVNEILQSEFGQTIGSKGVHIIDPFTGIGTFITRLLQSGLITPEQLPHKYKNEIHANEIVLLAYYIAAINIEAVYHSIVGGEYQPFEGICLTDTFQLYEKEDLISAMLVDNSTRRKRQKKLDIRVIMSNPPYSAGQVSSNDNNQNVEYLTLDTSIRGTYAKRSTATNKNALYDSYIRAIRWASDRIGNSGVVGFVTNAGYLESNTADGMRRCLAEEFSSIYVFHLRGNQRTSGELSRREGGKIFGSGSRAPIAISLLVKNPAAKRSGQISFYDIGDYLTREEKLEKVHKLSSVAGIAEQEGWKTINPDERGDWLSLRDASFDNYIALGDKKGNQTKLFKNYSCGVQTSRDVWCFNSSKNTVASNMQRMIDFYNSEVDRLVDAYADLDKETRKQKLISHIDTDPKAISWSRSLKNQLVFGRKFDFSEKSLILCMYRPFSKRWLYYDRTFNEVVFQMSHIFPDSITKNLVIVVTGIGEKQDFSAQIVDMIPEFKHHYNGQCFPLYLYDEENPAKNHKQASLFDEPKPAKAERIRRDAITDEGLAHFQEAYPGEQISKEDIFYYVYGLLHSPEYRERFADNLSKELPRIPRVKSTADFWAFSQAGRKLGDLHINYETVEPYPLTVKTSGKPLTDADYRVKKMKYGRRGKEKDLTTLIYNEKITLTGIPLEAYEYVVNGKPALDWVVERQCVKTDKASGIVNDANDWAIETMHNPRYPLDLFMRVVTVSLVTMKIVNALPKLDI